MLLTIDIGNTNIVIGKFSGEKLEFITRIMTNPTETDAEYAAKIKNILELENSDCKKIEGAIISSVVPPLTVTIKSAIKKLYGIDALVVGPGIKTGINLLVDNPAQVGADLICACVAAYNKYPTPALIVDMGTATKIMVVDENAVFVGVSIIPGAELSLKALSGGTAQLPQISLDNPGNVIAKNTVECMKSGVIYGNASMIDGMIERIEEESGKKSSYIATGGYAKTIIPHCKNKLILDENLLLDGLRIIYEKNR